MTGSEDRPKIPRWFDVMWLVIAFILFAGGVTLILTESPVLAFGVMCVCTGAFIYQDLRRHFL